MNRFLQAALLGAVSLPVFAANVGVSVTVGQPGFYGQLDIGGAPPPQLIYPQPVVIQRAPEFATAAPIYLHVPPGHEKHWNKHCAEYNACGRPVYFVKDDWYNKQYVPHYQNEHREHDHDHDHDHDHGHDHD
jgi:hypothetical protein